MQTTTYGYKIPETGDLAKNANGWLEAIENSLTRVDTHNHDGTNSPTLAVGSFAPYSQTIGVTTAYTVVTTSGNATLTGFASTTEIAVGQAVTGTNIQAASVVSSKTTSTVTLDKTCTGSGTVTATVSNWVPDGAGRGGYKQTKAVPAGVTDISYFRLGFVFTAPAARVGESIGLTYKRLTATTYEVYSNDITSAFTAIFR